MNHACHDAYPPQPASGRAILKKRVREGQKPAAHPHSVPDDLQLPLPDGRRAPPFPSLPFPSLLGTPARRCCNSAALQAPGARAALLEYAWDCLVLHARRDVIGDGVASRQRAEGDGLQGSLMMSRALSCSPLCIQTHLAAAAYRACVQCSV
ncbi:hypothetical protein CALCODRAFT_107995 [Calocera cornea HHB12733]|uniref:Uncharacterized protein n=1 Tax=Calocera cornea HHB12733 TaxID=1353952 RepID=A0A165IGI0_9BASI|nr:hypothetical protein CALCODRAFT_107995 [Calocera cornea HHB12733]